MTEKDRQKKTKVTTSGAIGACMMRGGREMGREGDADGRQPRAGGGRGWVWRRDMGKWQGKEIERHKQTLCCGTTDSSRKQSKQKSDWSVRKK